MDIRGSLDMTCAEISLSIIFNMFQTAQTFKQVNYVSVCLEICTKILSS